MRDIMQYYRFNAEVVNAVLELISRSRGNRVSFRPRDIARILGLKSTPVMFSMINSVMAELRERGLVEEMRTQRTVRYAVDKGTPLWKLAERGVRFRALSIATLPPGTCTEVVDCKACKYYLKNEVYCAARTILLTHVLLAAPCGGKTPGKKPGKGAGSYGANTPQKTPKKPRCDKDQTPPS